ncbi:hypothetical protein AVEN_125958-1 [Araneus ventricosus]|uniref:Uncharacterized protein n=1 Tax=Araneus ventricosus TaxID=182803 RepID=A0A4Y2GSZ4_ARAVE|nr:hypothetical protein AVEN_125958-1 [Araneus ventricosus]
MKRTTFDLAPTFSKIPHHTSGIAFDSRRQISMRQAHICDRSWVESGFEPGTLWTPKLRTNYCSATDSETTTFGRFHTGKRCQAMSHMSPFPEFFVRSR